MVPSSPNRAGLWLLEEAHPQLGLAGVFGLKTYVMAGQPDRDALKRRRDVLQADAVQVLLEQYLPQV